MIEFKLPDIGEGIAEGEIVQWLVAEGATVEEHQPVVEVMTDKATVEVPAPAAGTVTRFLAKAGDTVPVGSVIFHLDGAAAGGAAAGGAAPASAPAPGADRSGPVVEFKLPDIGEGIAEGEIVQWLVTEGTTVDEHQPVVEVMTDKATVEVPAPAAGTIVRLLAEAGQTVPVGNVIFHLARVGGAAAPAAAQVASAAVSNGASAGSNGAGAAAVAMAQPAAVSGAKVLAVPSARRVARELGIDLAQVPSSGRGGVVRRADVEAFASGAPVAAAVATPSAPQAIPAMAPPASLAPSAEDLRRPFRGVRRKIADAMVRSKYTAPHFTVVEEVDVTELVSLREAAKTLGAEQGVKVTYMPFIMRAVVLGLARFRPLNGRLEEETQEIVNPGYVNLGIATDTQNGLIVPVLDNCQSKSVMQLAAELGELAGRTRAGKVKPEELRGSTFTITNAGNIGGTLATPIINFPDIAILGVHRIVKRPGVVETPEGDRIEVRQYMNLSCSVDHRLADGADAARFLAFMRTTLEKPGLLAL